MDGDRTFDPKHMQSFSVSRADIENAEDYGEIFEIADALGVDLGGLDEIEDMKIRLLLFYDKCEGQPNYKDVVVESMLALYQEDKRKRERLVRILEATHEKLGPISQEGASWKQARRGSALIKGFLKSEGIIHNLESDIQQKIANLKHGKCTIVVSGETSSGKSSILNLLFGEEVVPTFHGSCTSVITRISYNRKRRAKIIYRNGVVKKMLDIPHGEIRQRLQPYLFVEDIEDRDRVPTIKEVVIQCPAKVLESGLVLVDSPGIGENDEMDKIIINFVEENQINVFLYIVKSDNGGGVDEDRLLNLLKVIIEKEKEKTEHGMLPFDPQCALFVCNQWDLIQKAEEDSVYRHTFHRLQSLWPNLNPSQVMKFSTLKARKECDIDPYFIIDSYKSLLVNVKDLFGKAVDRRVKSTYKWLETVLKRSVHHLKTIVHGIDNSEKDLETKMRDVWGKLNTLKMKSELVINRLRKQIDEETVQISEDFRTYLQSPKTKMAVTSWIESELPDVETIQNFGELKEILTDLSCARISKELENWEEENNKIRNVKKNVEAQIQLQLNILESELKDIEDDMRSDSDSVLSEDSIGPRNPGRRYSIPSVTLRMQISKFALPVKLANRMLKPFGKIGKRTSSIIAMKVNEGKMKAYANDPIGYAKKRSEKTLQSFLDERNDNLLSTISSFMNEPREYLMDIQKKIPAMVETNQQNMDHINLCRKEGLLNREMYEQMMEGVERLKRILTDYGEGYMFVNDFGADDIQILTDEDSSGYGRFSVPFDVSRMLDVVSTSSNKWNNKAMPRSLWAALQNGILLKDNCEDPVTIKIYLPNARLENTDAEVAKLRLMKNEHVAELLGIQNSTHPTPAFVFSGDLKPLRRYLKGKFVRIKDDIPRILHELVLGLEYIHRKKMVHMELNLSTVTIDDQANVKLTGACRPKVAALPEDKHIVLAGDFVYLSPEVLQGELYVACADVYAFGLLLFEILVGPAFNDQREWSLHEFTEKCKPYGLNACPYSTNELTESTKNTIHDCIDEVLEKRPCIEDLLRAVSNIKDEPALTHLKELQRNPQVQKSKSGEAVRTSSCCGEYRKAKLRLSKSAPGTSNVLSTSLPLPKLLKHDNQNNTISEERESSLNTEVQNISSSSDGKKSRAPLLGMLASSNAKEFFRVRKEPSQAEATSESQPQAKDLFAFDTKQSKKGLSQTRGRDLFANSKSNTRAAQSERDSMKKLSTEIEHFSSEKDSLTENMKNAAKGLSRLMSLNERTDVHPDISEDEKKVLKATHSLDDEQTLRNSTQGNHLHSDLRHS